MSERFFTTGDVAKLVGVSSEFIRKLARAGKIAYMCTARGQRIFRGEDVERLAAEREQRRKTKATITSE
jgi:excisionase family DNA binding protein